MWNGLPARRMDVMTICDEGSGTWMVWKGVVTGVGV